MASLSPKCYNSISSATSLFILFPCLFGVNRSSVKFLFGGCLLGEVNSSRVVETGSWVFPLCCLDEMHILAEAPDAGMLVRLLSVGLFVVFSCKNAICSK